MTLNESNDTKMFSPRNVSFPFLEKREKKEKLVWRAYLGQIRGESVDDRTRDPSGVKEKRSVHFPTTRRVGRRRLSPTFSRPLSSLLQNCKRALGNKQ